MADGLPAEMWFGTVRGEWPIRCWSSEAHALAWMQGERSGVVWKASIVDPVQYRLVEPKSYLAPVDKP